MTMNSRMAYASATIALILALGCYREYPANTRPHPVWNWDYRKEPRIIEVLGGTTFLCSGVRCQLLGIAESDDPVVRDRAVDFTKRWFSSIGDWHSACNDDNPLSRPDGTCLVWLAGADMYSSRLNVELVRAGLAVPDYDELRDYEFTIPGGKGEPRVVVENWRTQLGEAVESCKRGDPPHVVFEWNGIYAPDQQVGAHE